MDPLVIIIRSLPVRFATEHQLWEARLGDELLCTEREPFFAAARVLKARGVADEVPLVMRHAGSDEVSLRSTVGKAAGLTVEDGNGGTRVRPYRPYAPGMAFPSVP